MTDASCIAGQWVNTSTENHREYLEALGTSHQNITWLMAHKEPSIQYILHEDGKITEKMISTIFPREVTFKLGVEFEGDLPDDLYTTVKTKDVFTMEGNKLIHTMWLNNVKSVTVREFNGNEMVATHKAGRQVCTRRYKKREE